MFKLKVLQVPLGKKKIIRIAPEDINFIIFQN